MGTLDYDLVIAIAGLIVAIGSGLAAIFAIPNQPGHRIQKLVCALFIGLGGLTAAFIGGSRYFISESTELVMVSPVNGYKYSGNFEVDLAGVVNESQKIWVLARDADLYWYPISEANKLPNGHWVAPVRMEQIIGPVSICAVAVDENGAGRFQDYQASDKIEEGMLNLPAQSELQPCSSIGPA